MLKVSLHAFSITINLFNWLFGSSIKQIQQILEREKQPNLARADAQSSAQ